MRKADITVDLVSCLIAEQFPQWAELEVSPVPLDGWDNTTFRLGKDMSVRIPSHKLYVPQIDKEHRWLPVLAAQLPVPIPSPIAKGRPGCGFPAAWSIYGWLEGEPAAVVGVADYDRLAEDLAHFLAVLERVDIDDGPLPGPHSFNRGGPVSAWDEQTRATIEQLADEIDAAGAVAVWDAALAAEWSGPDVWVHGDVTGSNLLLRDDRLCGVIDFGCAAVGDPACDLTAAWTMFEGTSRERFMAALPFDQGTWATGAGVGALEGADRHPGTAPRRPWPHGCAIRVAVGRPGRHRSSDRRPPFRLVTVANAGSEAPPPAKSSSGSLPTAKHKGPEGTTMSWDRSVNHVLGPHTTHSALLC